MEDLLHFIAQQSKAIHTLQQQLIAQNTPRPEVTSPPKFDGSREPLMGFVNACCLYTKARLEGVDNRGRISWVLSYMQGGVAEVWKDNILEEIEKGTLEVETMEELFKKIREEFWEFDKESRKVNKLRLLVQGSRTCNKYVQEFKRVARGSGYKGIALIEEFKRGLNRTTRRRLAEVESPPSTITDWQERVVKLDRNMQQSRAEEKVLAGTMWSQGASIQQGGVRRDWTPRRGWQTRRDTQPQMPRLTGAETEREGIAVDWTARRAQVVCHQCRKKGHYMRECGEEARIRILELEKQVEELKGKEEQ